MSELLHRECNKTDTAALKPALNYLLTRCFYCFFSYCLPIGSTALFPIILFGPISYLSAVLVELIPFSCFYQAVLFATLSASKCKLSPWEANGWQISGFRWNGNRGYFPI